MLKGEMVCWFKGTSLKGWVAMQKSLPPSPQPPQVCKTKLHMTHFKETRAKKSINRPSVMEMQEMIRL